MSALRSYRLLVTWQARRMQMFLPLGIVVQALFAFGIVAGYPLLFPSIDHTTILYLATGGPAVSLITIGLVAVPQLVTQARTEGTLDYMRTLPVPRIVYLLADMTVWLAVVVPGVAFAVIVAVDPLRAGPAGQSARGSGRAAGGPDRDVGRLRDGVAPATDGRPDGQPDPRRVHPDVLAAELPGRSTARLAGGDPQRPADPGDGRGHARHPRLEHVPSHGSVHSCSWAPGAPPPSPQRRRADKARVISSPAPAMTLDRATASAIRPIGASAALRDHPGSRPSGAATIS